MANQFEDVLLNPAQYYDSPNMVIQDPNYKKEQKYAILKAWENEVKELLVMDDENMASFKPVSTADLLSEIENCIQQLKK